MPRVRAPTATCQRRQPTDTVLYRTVEAHLETFLAHTAGDAERSGLPVFVKREFEAYLARVPAAGPAPLRVAATLPEAEWPRRACPADPYGGVLQVTELEWTMPAVNRQLRDWERIYNTIRPYQAPGYRTPREFLQDLARAV